MDASRISYFNYILDYRLDDLKNRGSSLGIFNLLAPELFFFNFSTPCI